MGPEDMPPVCWVRMRRDGGVGYPFLVLHFDSQGVFVVHAGLIAVGIVIDWHKLSLDYEFSTDLRTWKKCEVGI